PLIAESEPLGGIPGELSFSVRDFVEERHLDKTATRPATLSEIEHDEICWIIPDDRAVRNVSGCRGC
ncbi:MAG: hypothetical protein P8Y47_13150, partial [Alphaproteobacteria bacterium]